MHACAMHLHGWLIGCLHAHWLRLRNARACTYAPLQPGCVGAGLYRSAWLSGERPAPLHTAVTLSTARAPTGPHHDHTATEPYIAQHDSAGKEPPSSIARIHIHPTHLCRSTSALQRMRPAMLPLRCLQNLPPFVAGRFDHKACEQALRCPSSGVLHPQLADVL